MYDDDRDYDRDTTTFARQIWNAAEPDFSWRCPAGRFLSKKFEGADAPWPAALRFSRDTYHPKSGGSHPALIVAITDARGDLVGVERLFLDPGGEELARVVPNRMRLGTGPGGAVRLGRHRPGDPLVIDESLMRALRLHLGNRSLPTWAAMSARGLAGLELPAETGNILVIPDTDAGRRAAAKKAERWLAEGRSVRVIEGPSR